jgi:hypothetical protein
LLSHVAQVSRTLLPDASGHDNNLGFSVFTAGQAHDDLPAHTSTTTEYPTSTVHSDHHGRRTTAVPQRRSQRRSPRVPHWRLRPRLAGSLLSACHGLTATRPPHTPSPVDGAIAPIDWDKANAAAWDINAADNAARTATRARTRHGELVGWRRLMSDLPVDDEEAADWLEIVAEERATQLRKIRADLQPAIARLVADQTSPTSWHLPVKKGARRGIWAGPEHWRTICAAAIAAARATGVTALGKPVELDCSPANTTALLGALAASFDAAGHTGTAATATLVHRARKTHGATCSITTGCRRLRSITRILIHADLLIVQARGRFLYSIERLAARYHHGGRQTRAANHLEANVPAHLLPRPQDGLTAPAWAAGLAERLSQRNDNAVTGFRPGMTVGDWVVAKARERHINNTATCTDDDPSTYTYGSSFQSPPGGSRVAHARASAPANTEKSSQTKRKAENRHRISVRAWRITDDLTRSGVDRGPDAGPYRHLIGTGPDQMTPQHFARLIDDLTPVTAGTREVLSGLAHAATSTATGYVALGLNTRPTRAAAWWRTALSRIDWDQPDSFPSWSRTAEAFGLDWCGPRRDWSPVG